MKGWQALPRDGSFAPERFCIFAGAALCSTVTYHIYPHAPAWLAAALAGIVLAVWHGAYDEVLAEQVLPAQVGARWRLPFFAGYLALAGVVLLIWWFVPAMALPEFLLYSAVHFGTEAEPPRSFGQLFSAAGAGFVPIAAACHWWPAPVSAIFTAMLRGNHVWADQLTHLAGAALLLSVVLALAGVFASTNDLCARGALLATELLLFRFCPPLVAFAVYFCLWHTPEHLVETNRNSTGRFAPGMALRNLQRGLWPWLVSVAAMLCAGWFGRHAVQAYAGVVFLALSALTVPHMVLGLLHQRHNRTLFPATPELQLSRSA